MRKPGERLKKNMVKKITERRFVWGKWMDAKQQLDFAIRQIFILGMRVKELEQKLKLRK